MIDRDWMRRDIQLKGAGPTPFSRRGDGRATLGPNFSQVFQEALRECRATSNRSAIGVAQVATSGRSHVWSLKRHSFCFLLLISPRRQHAAGIAFKKSLKDVPPDEIVRLVEEGKVEPVARQLFREAWALKDRNPSSALAIGWRQQSLA